MGFLVQVASLAICHVPGSSLPHAAARFCPLQLLLPDGVNFSCSSLIVSTSAAAPQLHLLQLSFCSRLCLFRVLLRDCTLQLHPFQRPATFWKVPTPAQRSRAFLAEFKVLSIFSRYSTKVTHLGHATPPLFATHTHAYNLLYNVMIHKKKTHSWSSPSNSLVPRPSP